MSAAEWLAGPQAWAAGVMLHQQLGGSAVYQQLFALGETGYSRKVLVEQLQLLAGPVEEVPRLSMEYLAEQRRQLSDQAFRQEVLNTPPAVPEPPPELLTDVRAQLKACRDERSQLHAQLTASGMRVTVRCKLAQRICALTDQVQQLLAHEAHVLEYGRLPGKVATEHVTDAGELRRRLDNLVALRSKVRRRPERAGELPALEAEIDLIRNKLNPPQRD